MDLKVKGAEVFVGGLNKEETTVEDIQQVFAPVGEIAEVRLMKDKSGQPKGFAFVRYVDKDSADRAVKELNQTVIKGKAIGVKRSTDRCSLFVGNLKKEWTTEEIDGLLRASFEGVVSVNLPPDSAHPERNRGFCFVEFCNHASAAAALSRAKRSDFSLGGIYVGVNWQEEADEEQVSKVKSVYVCNLAEDVSEEELRALFGQYGPIDRVTLAKSMASAKRRDFAFVNFESREHALAAIEGLNGSDMNGRKIECCLAKPVEKKRPDFMGAYMPYGGSMRAMPRAAPAHVALYKTQLCTKYQAGSCTFGYNCRFAHGEHELRPMLAVPSTLSYPVATVPFPNSQQLSHRLCKSYMQTGYCNYGPKCHFFHGWEELRVGLEAPAMTNHRPARKSNGGPRNNKKQ